MFSHISYQQVLDDFVFKDSKSLLQTYQYTHHGTSWVTLPVSLTRCRVKHTTAMCIFTCRYTSKCGKSAGKQDKYYEDYDNITPLCRITLSLPVDFLIRVKYLAMNQSSFLSFICLLCVHFDDGDNIFSP